MHFSIFTLAGLSRSLSSRASRLCIIIIIILILILIINTIIIIICIAINNIIIIHNILDIKLTFLLI